MNAPKPSPAPSGPSQAGLVEVRDRQDRLAGVLTGLAAQPGFLGAAVVSRDGIRISDVWNRETWNKETFSAMSATLMGAAEIALAEMGSVRARRVVAETAKSRMGVIGVSDELVLVGLAETGIPLDRFLPLLEAAAGQVEALVGGA